MRRVEVTYWLAPLAQRMNVDRIHQRFLRATPLLPLASAPSTGMVSRGARHSAAGRQQRGSR
jgi:hypothetical protein